MLPAAGGFLSFDNEPDQYLFCCVLRAGNAVAKTGCLSILKRLLPRLRKAFRKAKIRIRLDAGFTGPELYDFFEAERLRLRGVHGEKPGAATFCRAADGTASRSPGSRCRPRPPLWRMPLRCTQLEVPATRDHQSRYRLASRPQAKDNPRFIVTNLTTTPKFIYQKVYCARGDIENRIKELKHGLEIDRTSCSSFKANQFRLLMTAAAYVLMQELRLHARRTGCARAQVNTLRLRLLKLGVWIESSVRRIVLHLPMSTPYADDWRRIARSVGAVPT